MTPRRATAMVAFVAAAVLSCTSCVVQPAPRPVVAAPPPPPPPPSSPVSSYCREFIAPVTINGEPTDATGEACLQPDGTWQVTENATGVPPGVPQPQVFVVPPPPTSYVTYPYPWWGTANIRVGGGISFSNRGRRGAWRGGWRHRRF